MRALLIVPILALLLLCSFRNHRKDKFRLPDSYVRVPTGTYYDQDRSRKQEVATGKTTIWKIDSAAIIQTGGFYISRYEISNIQYREFYNEVSPTLTDAEKEKIACDTLGWRQELTYNEPLKDFYHRHPAFDNYPAVNIPYDGAIAYCKWLEEKIQKENPRFEIKVRLPSKIEWVYSAQGGRANAMYPWGNYYLRNNRGQFLCNYRHLGDEAIVRNRTTDKPEVDLGRRPSFDHLGGTFTTAPVKSYAPNDYGIYNTCGNVAEMIEEKGVAMGGSWNDFGGDVHIKAQAKYEMPMPTVGFRPVIEVKEKNN